MLQIVRAPHQKFDSMNEAETIDTLETGTSGLLSEAFEPGSSIKVQTERRVSMPDEDIFVEILSFNKGKVFFNRIEQIWKPLKNMELFFYLLLHRETPVPLEEISQALWPSATLKNGLRNTKKAMAELRRHLDAVPRENIKIIYLNDTYTLSLKGCYYDVEQFEKVYALAMDPNYNTSQQLSFLVYLQDLYDGPILHKNNWQWCTESRERLSAQFFTAALKLSEYLLELKDYSRLFLCYEKLVRNGFSNRAEVKNIRKRLFENHIHGGIFYQDLAQKLQEPL